MGFDVQGAVERVSRNIHLNNQDSEGSSTTTSASGTTSQPDSQPSSEASSEKLRSSREATMGLFRAGVGTTEKGLFYYACGPKIGFDKGGRSFSAFMDGTYTPDARLSTTVSVSLGKKWQVGSSLLMRANLHAGLSYSTPGRLKGEEQKSLSFGAAGGASVEALKLNDSLGLFLMGRYVTSQEDHVSATLGMIINIF